MRAKRLGANSNRGETTQGEWDSGQNDPVPWVLATPLNLNFKTKLYVISSIITCCFISTFQTIILYLLSNFSQLLFPFILRQQLLIVISQKLNLHVTFLLILKSLIKSF